MDLGLLTVSLRPSYFAPLQPQLAVWGASPQPGTPLLLRLFGSYANRMAAGDEHSDNRGLTGRRALSRRYENRIRLWQLL